MLTKTAMLRAVLTGIACSAVYLLLAGTVSETELLTATWLGGLGLLWTLVQRRIPRREFVLSAAHMAVWLHAVVGVPSAVLRTGMALFRALLGRNAGTWQTRERPFRHGPRDDSRERARRVTALLAASLAPASFVVRAAPGRDVVLLHGIGDVPSSEDAEWLT